MKYGVVLACCKGSDGRAVCVVRGLDTLLSPLGDPITNAYDCPLLSLTRTIFTARTLDVLKAVSVVHECARTCEFKIKEYPRSVEREEVSLSRLEYVHDFCSNLLYCLNVYCMRT